MKRKILHLRPEATEAGFTIIEVMVASLVVLISLVATTLGITSAMSNSVFIENQNTAERAAAEVLASASQASYENLYTQQGGVAVPGAELCETDMPEESVTTGGEPFTLYCQELSSATETFTVQTNVIWVAAGKQVAVTVSWVDVSSDDAHSVIRTQVFSPTIADCVPSSVALGEGLTQSEGCNS